MSFNIEILQYVNTNNSTIDFGEGDLSIKTPSKPDYTTSGSKTISGFKTDFKGYTNTWTETKNQNVTVTLKTKLGSVINTYQTINKTRSDKYSCSQDYKFAGITKVKVGSNLGISGEFGGSFDKTFTYKGHETYDGTSRDFTSSIRVKTTISNRFTNKKLTGIDMSTTVTYSGKTYHRVEKEGQIKVTGICNYLKDGSQSSVLSSKGSYSYTLPTPPQINGYEFKHWEDSSGNIKSGTVNGLKDSTAFIAVYKSKTTNITYKNLYTVSNTPPDKYTLGQQINYNNFEFSRPGYTFSSLSVDDGKIENGVFTPPVDGGDVIVTINWNPNKYTYTNKLMLEGTDTVVNYFNGKDESYSSEDEISFTPDDINNPVIKEINDLDLIGYTIPNSYRVTSVSRPNNWGVEVGKSVPAGTYSNKYGDLNTILDVNTIKYNIDFKGLSEDGYGPTFYTSNEKSGYWKRISELNISNLVKFDNYNLSSSLSELLNNRKDLIKEDEKYFYDILTEELELDSDIEFYNNYFKFIRTPEYNFGLSQGFYPTKYDGEHFYKIKNIDGNNYTNFYGNSKINISGPYKDHSDVNFSQVYQIAKYVFRYHYKYETSDEIADSKVLYFGDVIDGSLPEDSSKSIWPVGKSKEPITIDDNFTFGGWEDSNYNLVIGYNNANNLMPLTEGYILYQRVLDVANEAKTDSFISNNLDYNGDGKITAEDAQIILNLETGESLISESNTLGTVDISSLKKFKETLQASYTDEGYLYLYNIITSKPKYFCRKSLNEVVLTAEKNNSGEITEGYDEYTRVIDLYPRWIKNQGLQVNDGYNFKYLVESGENTNLDYIKVYDNGWKQTVEIKVFDGEEWKLVNINQRPKDPPNPTRYQEI